jgi:acetyltransferase-like isoleucine patch superfamily enzyme
MVDIGELTGDWDYSTLPANVRVGHRCFLEDRGSFRKFLSRQDPGLIIGDRVKAYNWTAFSVDPTGYLEVGDDCTLVGAIFWCGHRIILGKRVQVSYNVMIADSDFHPKDPDLRRLDAKAISPFGNKADRPAIDHRPVIIEDDVEIGIGAIILKGVRIGAGAKVLPGSVCSRDVPPGAVVSGNPARVAQMEVLT